MDGAKLCCLYTGVVLLEMRGVADTVVTATAFTLTM
jgi:hypothetical protein